MIAVLVVAGGGAVGASVRWFLTQRDGDIPWLMMALNVAASGVAAALHDLDGSWRWLLNIGSLGALSTWSSLAVATVRLVQAGHRAAATAVVVGTTLASIGVAAVLV